MSTYCSRFVVGFASLWLALYGLGQFGSTSVDHGLAAGAVVVGLGVAVEIWLSGGSVGTAAWRLGMGAPPRRALGAAGVVSLTLVATLPAYAALSGEHLQLRSGWPWLLVGLCAYHGVAEELCWRGYAFGQLRHGRSFRTAVVATMPLIAITHIPVLLESGIAVGVAAVIVAAVTCIPLAHLYELGGRTIWAAAIVHAAIDTFKLFEDPGAAPELTVAITAAALVLPFVAFAWRTQPDPRPPIPSHARAALVLTTRKEQS